MTVITTWWFVEWTDRTSNTDHNDEYQWLSFTNLISHYLEGIYWVSNYLFSVKNVEVYVWCHPHIKLSNYYLSPLYYASSCWLKSDTCQIYVNLLKNMMVDIYGRVRGSTRYISIFQWFSLVRLQYFFIKHFNRSTSLCRTAA